jgi:hypothetical protein
MITAASIISLIAMLEPLAIPLVKDIQAIFTKYPNMTPDQMTALVQQLATAIHATNADTLSLIAADQAAHLGPLVK